MTFSGPLALGGPLQVKILLKIWFLQDSHHYFVKFLNLILPQGLDFLQIMVLSLLIA